MIELSTNTWVNPEQIVSIHKQSNKVSGEVKLFIRMSNGEVYDIMDLDGDLLKKILKTLK